MTAHPELALALQFRDTHHRGLLSRHRVARWIRAAVASPAQVTVRVVGEPEGRALNRDFRGKDYATNVLTFSYASTPVVVADLVVCAPVVAREAREQQLDLVAHYAHLIVHGTLHAQGYSHAGAADARIMESEESRVLLALGFPDPYRRSRVSLR